MGFISWLFGGRSGNDRPSRKVYRINNGPGNFDIDVVGESHYQVALGSICGGRAPNSQRVMVEACLVPEDDNPHDPQAVCVFINDEIVGYLDRETAREWRTALSRDFGDLGAVVVCDAIIVGGWDRGPDDQGSFGVRLDLPIE